MGTTAKKVRADDTFLERQVARRVDLIEGAMARLDRQRQARERVDLKEWEAELTRRSLEERLEEKAVRARMPELQRASEVRKVQRLRKEMLITTHEMIALVQKAEKDGNYAPFHRRLKQLAATTSPTAVEAARQETLRKSASTPTLTRSRPQSASSDTMSPSGRPSRISR